MMNQTVVIALPWCLYDVPSLIFREDIVTVKFFIDFFFVDQGCTPFFSNYVFREARSKVLIVVVKSKCQWWCKL